MSADFTLGDDDPEVDEPIPTEPAIPTALEVDDEDTLLAELRADLAKETVPTVTLPIPGRPGWEAEYRVDVRGAQLDGWRKRAQAAGKRGRLDPAIFAGILLAELNVGLHRQGKPIVLDGEPATFRSEAYLELLEVNGARPAVLKTYALEGQTDAAARAVLKAAGWGDDVEELDNP